MAIRKKIGFRIDPLDLDTRKAIGVKIPFNKSGVFQFNYTTKEQIKSNLINLLLTSPGERYHQPSYGVGIRDILFDRNISFHIPQIKLSNLEVTPQDKELLIQVAYVVLLDNDTNEISLTL